MSLLSGNKNATPKIQFQPPNANLLLDRKPPPNPSWEREREREGEREGNGRRRREIGTTARDLHLPIDPKPSSPSQPQHIHPQKPWLGKRQRDGRRWRGVGTTVSTIEDYRREADGDNSDIVTPSPISWAAVRYCGFPGFSYLFIYMFCNFVPLTFEFMVR